MQALVFDPAQGWETSRGFEKRDVPQPVLDVARDSEDAHRVIIKVHYAGVCGSDRGMWFRAAFKDQILGTIAAERAPWRVMGHEFFGEVAAVGSRVMRVRPGDFASCESHVICTECWQCRNGEQHVCTNEKILGISTDGCFAEYIKVPQHIVWPTDTSRIRPEVAAMQEPFGNAVHAASQVPLAGRTVAIFGLGPIAMFLSLVARGMGATTIIGVEPNPRAADMARHLGIDYVIPLEKHAAKKDAPFAHDESVTEHIREITGGLGVDVAFEMAGFNDSVNNAIFSTRRGGDVILFGLKNGDFVLENYNRLIVYGVTLHAVIGRQIWQTWETTRALLQDPSNKIQERLFTVILNEGKGTILPIGEYTKEVFEKKMAEHPKILLQF
ncbi:MAG: alcohol dehydrogenase catalytic domain-containing protein [Patescibacteria group bacterium]